MRSWRKWISSQVPTGVCAFCTNSVFTFLNFKHPQLLVAMFLTLVNDCSGLGLALNLREFPLTALCAVGGNGLFRRSLPVCAHLAQTKRLQF